MAARRDGVVVFALFDIDGFHDVNDMLGWAGGDTMLVSIVERLKVWLPDGALFGRYQDDEFAVIVGSADAQSRDRACRPDRRRARRADLHGSDVADLASASASRRRRKTARPATN